MDGLIFKPETHQYFLGGVQLPSVTGVIADTGLYGNTSYFTDYSRDRGSFVHQIVQWHLSGELDEETIDPVLRPYFDAWLRFESESKYISDSCEEALASTTYRYAGTIDHIGHLNGHFCIIDVKSGALHPATALQLAGYENLLKARGAKRFSLELKADGKYKLTEHKDRSDRDIFLAALSLYYWKQNHNVKG
jgi:hypothetical protein